ncbi:MAG: RNA ligase family protein [DPANN group archaeon]|nr:RNA ligase family protein [DPANN group archaeon]
MQIQNNPKKPLGIKAYGHIPHLPGSRLGPGDHKCSDGQARICTQKTRDKHDLIIVQEKVDGSCVAVARLDDKILALNRAGYLAQTSPYEHHQLFAYWVRENESRFSAALNNGERLCGEWLALAHGTLYNLPPNHGPFVAFDLILGNARTPYYEFKERLGEHFVTPRVIHTGGPLGIESLLKVLEPSGHGAIDPVGGAVWRVERNGEVDFLAKWVRPDKLDGKYLPEVSGGRPIWNWRPKT